MKTGERERTSHGPTGPRDVMDPHVHVDERVDLRRLTSRVSPLTTNPTTSDADGRPHSYDDVPAIVTWTDVITMGGHVVSTIELVWCRHGRRSREVGPAVVEVTLTFDTDPGGTRLGRVDRLEWWFDGMLHNDTGPAKVERCGPMEWWHRGLRHREGGPAVVWRSRCMPDQYWWYGHRRVGGGVCVPTYDTGRPSTVERCPDGRVEHPDLSDSDTSDVAMFGFALP